MQRTFDCFLTHDWGIDSENRATLARAASKSACSVSITNCNAGSSAPRKTQTATTSAALCSSPVSIRAVRR